MRLVALLYPALLGAAVQEFRLPAFFTDHMVLQRGMPVPVWGWAAPGTEVKVSIAGQEKKTSADVQGRWMVRLDPLEKGGPLELSAGPVTIKDVLVGDVWICSGQSNMEMNVKSSNNAAKEIESANHPKIRLFTVAKAMRDEPERDVKGAWVECSPKTVGSFSAVGYFFGREVEEATGAPIGLIHNSWGGQPVEAFTSRQALESDSDAAKFLERIPRLNMEYEKKLAEWKEAAAKAKEEGKKAPPQPKAQNPVHTRIYNGMVAPLIPFAIKGAIWYQGESNAGAAKKYRTLFPLMIRQWRKDWGQGDFPFLYVQLVNFMTRKPQPSESSWAELREAQLVSLAEPNTAMAVGIDVGEAKDIHPKDKLTIGHRLALGALAKVYGKNVVFSGPIFESMKVQGAEARLTFKHIGGGLVARGDKLAGFAVAGEDRKFVWAEARIDGDQVVVKAEGVSAPQAVRYAWADNPEANLYNKEGLPASPFRTDDWPRP